MIDAILEILWSVLCRIAEGILWLFGTGFRKLMHLFRRANRVPLLALATLLLLPSCVQWRLGENVLTASETYVGIDYRHPEGGQLYCLTEKDGTRRYFARLPEVRFHRMPPLVSSEMPGMVEYDASVVEPTGRHVLAELDTISSRQPVLCGCKRLVTTLPADAQPLPPADYEYNAREMVTGLKPEPGSAPGGTRRAVAAALSYSLDPLLTFTCTTVTWCVALPLELISLPFYALLHQAEPQESHEPAPDGAYQGRQE